MRLLLALAVIATPLAAQNSIFGVRGLGFPGRVSSAQARGMAGAEQVLDATSALNPAAVALFPAATAGITVTGGYRAYDLGGVQVSGLRETRFPVVVAGGRLSSRFGFGFTMSTYAERTWDLTATDTITLRGTPVEVQDRVRSLGSIADVAGSLAFRPVPQVALGVGVHAITGSSRLDARRVFADSNYREYRQSAQTAHHGWGVGGGAVVQPMRGIQLGVAVRVDGTLASEVDSLAQPDVNLPTTIAAGFNAAPLPGMRIAGAAVRRTWSDAAATYASDTDTRDTWEFSGGVAFEGDPGPPLPLRLGLRYAQLPFTPAGTSAAREIDVSVGTGFRFGAGRGLLDLAVERVHRDGGGVSERVWQITMGMTVRP